ncbi:MAG: YbhB/YbcL family Raf kinase inhibitor-like protein, partial [Burkholderiaceae bacterium]|nr:YbhB/YbcL family Raf kinase inhibitor-like protein [Burkholderiaceae bacterium]
MKIWSNSFADGGRIPGEFAFAVIDPAHHVKLSTNRNPHLAWSDAPPATKSFVLLCHDYDVPSRPDDVNQEGREIPASLPRVDFFHWVLVDIPASMTAIEAGAFSNGVTPRGKSGPAAPFGTRQGINDYTGWFANDR